MSNKQTEQFEESKSDAEIEAEYRRSQGLDCHDDMSTSLRRKKIKESWVKKKYKNISKVYKLNSNQVFVIFNKI